MVSMRSEKPIQYALHPISQKFPQRRFSALQDSRLAIATLSVCTMTTPNPVSLPIIDLKEAKDPSQRLAVARQLVDALEKVGFLFVDNVEGYDAERLLKNTQWFFSLSQQEKHRLVRKIWNPESRNCYRGMDDAREL